MPPPDQAPPLFIRLLTRLGSRMNLDPEERRKRISAVFILLSCIFVFFTFSFYHIYARNYHLLPANGTALVGFFLILLALRRLQRGILMYWTLSLCLILFCGIIVVMGRTEISFFLWVFVFPAAVFSVLGARQGLIAILLFLFLSLVLMIAPRGWFRSSPYSNFIIVRYTVIYLIISFIFFYYETSQQILIKYIEQERNKFERASKKDVLTGLSNRRDMAEKMAAERARQLRMGHPFTVILGDIDDFKIFNDTYGHEAGDYALKKVAREMRRYTRDIDCPARWGGEEFLIMLVETDGASGQKVAERLRQSIADIEFTWQGTSLPLTMTFGVTTFRGAEDDIDSCIKRADQALYEGKRQGKNQVVLYS
ncbi:MAG: GGDEF domain-containing protein [Desulfosudaceae bacterium]